MKANNYEVVEAGEVITFRGLVKKSLSQALFLTFCVIFGMGSLALVLQIGLQDFCEYEVSVFWCHIYEHVDAKY